MDIDTAYLYGELSPEVYMRYPDGYQAKPDGPIAHRLIKALYGLKQSGREWFGTLKNQLETDGTESASRQSKHLVRTHMLRWCRTSW